jgi:alpha-amylase
LIGETNVFDGNMIKPIEEGGLGFDAIWCDDLMHGLYSIGTPETQLTERKYQGLGDVAEALQHGYLFSGPPRKRIARDEDTVADRWCVPSLVVSTQTHDSVGNQPLGKRLHHLAGVDFQMAASALSLLYPGIPMLFMGEETAEPNPFHYFVDFGDPWLKKAIENGRRHEHPQQDWAETVSPLDEQAFAGSRLTDVDANAEDRIRTREWYRRLIQIRRVWIELGLLQPNNLRVESDKGNQQVTLRYQSDPHQSSVWVQLAGEPDMTAAAALEQASKNLPGQVIASTFCSDETDPVPKTFAIVTSTKNE